MKVGSSLRVQIIQWPKEGWEEVIIEGPAGIFRFGKTFTEAEYSPLKNTIPRKLEGAVIEERMW